MGSPDYSGGRPPSVTKAATAPGYNCAFPDQSNNSTGGRMPKFNANLSMMFNEVGFLERFDAAARAGFKGVEFLFPYDFPAAQIREKLDRNRLEMVLFNMPPGNFAAGERGMA